MSAGSTAGEYFKTAPIISASSAWTAFPSSSWIVTTGSCGLSQRTYPRTRRSTHGLILMLQPVRGGCLMSKSSAWYARRYVERFGFHIVPIEPGRKFPRSADWGNSCLSTAEEAEQFYQSRPDWNMGVALGPSRVG